MTERLLNTSDLQRAFEYANSTGDRLPRILFICPRRSGKTTALFGTFLQTPNSIFMTPFGSTIRSLRAEATRRNTRGDNLRPMYDIVSLNSTTTMRGRMRRFSTVFIDDAQRYMGDWEELIACLQPCIRNTDDIRRGIVAAMTPSDTRGLGHYSQVFRYIRRPLDIEEVEVIRRTDFDRNHFNDEDFTI